MNVKAIQTALLNKGFKPGPVDGVMGPMTEKAIIAFKVSHGLKARAYIGPITANLLFDGGAQRVAGDKTFVPYLNELSKWLGTHETDRALAQWLASDGKTVGNPDDIPWCADAIQTSVRLTMPDEPFTGRMHANPFLAANWIDFGTETPLAYGAICSFWRESPASWKGHLAIAIGYDPKRDRIRIRGGNQRDMVSDTWIEKRRLREHGARVPTTLGFKLPPVPIMDSNGAVISTNEV